MKPLLRTFLAINAVTVALLGLFFLMTPWLAVSAPLAPLASSPALIGQLLGVLLLGFTWMLLAGMIRGSATATIGWVSGHILWLAGATVLIWQLTYHQPVLEPGPAFVVPAYAVLVILLGLIQARLASMVGRRERRDLSEARSASREALRRQRAAESSDGHPSGSRFGGMTEQGGTPMFYGSPRAVYGAVDRDPYIGTPPAAASRDTTANPFAEEVGTVRATRTVDIPTQEDRHALVEGGTLPPSTPGTPASEAPVTRPVPPSF
ncbi:hypothetical protein WM40_13200 [Robbsia andropogonis]|uniref:Transmembrane protein n=1 Tax=Robbsia andropogonis TaxID=28092 RepID=A0A0F5JZT5_9BURK|nr:hypothetical protein [Robbsia andropogonis]KKB63185.1 hypothetical protein WM40_13200 [Robbsia andropogonis]MCP1117599.1 hypothetical protein [Robbsia andropogonis]MCP1127065.1 hypothetical protein [Robbsia andropogonis]